MGYAVPMWILACVAPPAPEGVGAASGGGGDLADEGGPEEEDRDGTIPGGKDTADDEEEEPPEESLVFSDDGVLDLRIELTDDAILQLQGAPKEWVEGRLVYGDEVYEPVGVKLKGNSTFQWITARPALKVKFDEYVVGGRFHGLERLTLNSNYWDGSMMAETLAYRTWRQADSPAPRTGYAWVSLNGEAMGLYTILESMDDQFVEQWWPGSDGGLYEMNRSCDFNGSASCYELQDTGENFDPDGLQRACDASASGRTDRVRRHWDWERFLSFQAVELVINHPDTYSYNLNNYYVYHDPIEDRVTLTPWGADSTFTYVYPPDLPDHACEAIYLDDLASYPAGYMARWCRGDAECWADLKQRILDVADMLEDEDLVGYIDHTRERIEEYVENDPRWPWGLETFHYQVYCFRDWTSRRPDVIREWVASQG